MNLSNKLRRITRQARDRHLPLPGMRMMGWLKFITFAAVVCLAAIPLSVSAIVYQPPAGTSMWDTWMFCEGKDAHLFYLRSEVGKEHWNSIGHAVSQDLVHWKELPPIPAKGAEGSWDHAPTLTGCTVKRGDTYYLFYGAANPRQQVGVMTSKDLIHWQKEAGNPVLESRPPLYGDGFDWRDLSAYFDAAEQQWHGVICARAGSEHTAANPSPNPSRDAKRGQPAIGHLVSSDLLHWEQRPPLFTSWRWSNTEVPEAFTLGGKHYLLFSNGGSLPETSGRKKAGGTFYLMADKFEGPYRIPEEPLLLGWGGGHLDNYVGRVVRYRGELLLYHHTCGGPVKNDHPEDPKGLRGLSASTPWQPGVGGPVTWGAPKSVQQRADGSLWLKYWPGMDQLERRLLFDGAPPQAVGEEAVRWLPVQAADLSIVLRFSVEKDASPVGLIWRWNGMRGGAVSVQPSDNKVAIGELSAEGAAAPEMKSHDEIISASAGAGEHLLRVLVRGHRAEVYLDERWLFATPTLGNGGASGKVGFLTSSRAELRNVRVAELEPLQQ